jgi:hypothetical protein
LRPTDILIAEEADPKIAPLCRHERLAERENRLRAAPAKAEAEKPHP